MPKHQTIFILLCFPFSSNHTKFSILSIFCVYVSFIFHFFRPLISFLIPFTLLGCCSNRFLFLSTKQENDETVFSALRRIRQYKRKGKYLPTSNRNKKNRKATDIIRCWSFRKTKKRYWTFTGILALFHSIQIRLEIVPIKVYFPSMNHEVHTHTQKHVQDTCNIEGN